MARRRAEEAEAIARKGGQTQEEVRVLREEVLELRGSVRGKDPFLSVVLSLVASVRGDLLRRLSAARDTSLSESETERAWFIAERQQQEEMAAKARAELEAECQSAKNSTTKTREELEGNVLAPSCPLCLVSRSCR